MKVRRQRPGIQSCCSRPDGRAAFTFGRDAMKKGLLALAAVGLLVAADEAKDAKNDLDALQGEWTMVSGERNGEKLPEEIAKSLRRVIKGDKFTILRGDETVSQGTFTLDPSRKPREIDAKMEGADGTVKGIYALDGDTFKVCYGPPGTERPKEFGTKEGSNLILGVWKKARK
jgi:uncharacterized protein (TIGR03067 family)